MKMRLIAAALLCLAGSAQAATLNWDDADVTANADQTFDWSRGSFSVALAFNLASLDGDETTLLSVDAGSSKNQTLTIKKAADSGDVILGMTWSDDGSWSKTKDSSEMSKLGGALKKGENLISIVVDSHNNQVWMNWYINGIFFSGATDSVGSRFTGEGGAQFANVELNGVTPGVGGTLYTVAGVATKEDIGLLPEPTALAVLALGVAGAALRRRVA